MTSEDRTLRRNPIDIRERTIHNGTNTTFSSREAVYHDRGYGGLRTQVPSIRRVAEGRRNAPRLHMGILRQERQEGRSWRYVASSKMHTILENLSQLILVSYQPPHPRRRPSRLQGNQYRRAHPARLAAPQCTVPRLQPQGVPPKEDQLLRLHRVEGYGR